MKELEISCTVTKRIQEDRYEPYEISITAKEGIPTSSARTSAFKDLHRELDNTLDMLLQQRAQTRR